MAALPGGGARLLYQAAEGDGGALKAAGDDPLSRYAALNSRCRSLPALRSEEVLASRAREEDADVRLKAARDQRQGP
jgi:hypothetical protein